MDEAAKYYGNILWPLSTLILKKIDEIKKMNLDFDMIAPSHGIIWRKNPSKIIDAYSYWANNSTVNKAVIVYETMWGSTERMARRIAQGLIDSGVNVSLFDINQADRTQIIKEMLSSKGFIFGSSTHDNDMLTNIAGFLEFVKGLKPKNRTAACFGSYGWAGGAVKKMEELFLNAGIKIAQEALAVRFVPDLDELKDCYEFGQNFAEKIKQ
jgi:flavorubredoxin